MSLMGMAKMYNKRPSEFFDLKDDEYTAYCLDETCAYIQLQINDGKEPRFRVKAKSFRDFYDSLGAVNA